MTACNRKTITYTHYLLLLFTRANCSMTMNYVYTQTPFNVPTCWIQGQLHSSA